MLKQEASDKEDSHKVHQVENYRKTMPIRVNTVNS